MATLTLKAGDDISRTVTIKDSAGDAVNITGGTVKFKISKNLTDTDANALYLNTAVTLSNPTSGIATLTITDTVSAAWTPGNYYWEVEYIDSATLKNHTDADRCIITQSMYANG